MFPVKNIQSILINWFFLPEICFAWFQAGRKLILPWNIFPHRRKIMPYIFKDENGSSNTENGWHNLEQFKGNSSKSEVKTCDWHGKMTTDTWSVSE